MHPGFAQLPDAARVQDLQELQVLLRINHIIQPQALSAGLHLTREQSGAVRLATENKMMKSMLCLVEGAELGQWELDAQACKLLVPIHVKLPTAMQVRCVRSRSCPAAA